MFDATGLPTLILVFTVGGSLLGMIGVAMMLKSVRPAPVRQDLARIVRDAPYDLLHRKQQPD